MIGTFMAVLDATIVNVALNKIMASFGIPVEKAEWVLTSYMLVMAVMMPSSGWIADHFGYKRTYFLALFTFTLGSLLCALSWDINALIFFRVIQGMGTGMLMPVGMAIVTREFPPEKRGMALGFWGIAAAASVSFGPAVGGYLTDTYSWQSIFYINVPVGLVALLGVWIFQHEFKTSKIRSFDLVGFISMTVFLCALLLALAEGNAAWNTGGWTSNFIITCTAIAIIGFTIFLYTELTVTDPLIDLSLFKNFNYTVTSIVLFIFGLGMFGSTFLLPVYLQSMIGYTALQAGLVFVPVGILQGMLSPVAGMLADRYNPKIVSIFAILVMAFSLYLNASLSLYSENYQIMMPLYLRGLSMGLLFISLSAIAVSDMPENKMAQAAGLFNVIRQIGGSFGVAFFSTMLIRRQIFHMNIYGQAVDQYSPTFQNVSRALQGLAQHVGSGASQAVSRGKGLIISHIGKQAFVASVDDIFLIAGVIMIISLIPVFLIRVKKRAKKPGAHIAIEE